MKENCVQIFHGTSDACTWKRLTQNIWSTLQSQVIVVNWLKRCQLSQCCEGFTANICINLPFILLFVDADILFQWRMFQNHRSFNISGSKKQGKVVRTKKGTCITKSRKIGIGQRCIKTSVTSFLSFSSNDWMLIFYFFFNMSTGLFCITVFSVLCFTSCIILCYTRPQSPGRFSLPEDKQLSQLDPSHASAPHRIIVAQCKGAKQSCSDEN